MNSFATSVILGWIPAVLLIYAVMDRRKATLIALVGGWLFLPGGRFSLPGLPDFDKATFTSVAMLAGTVVFSPDRLRSVRFCRWDIPIVVWCTVPLLSSLTNGHGLYDGFSGIFGRCVHWGVPYLIGRAYFSDSTGIRALATAALIGGLIYVPFCLWEIRLSPGLHKALYGFRTSGFVMHIRFGGYRPSVFLHSGLAIGMWMAAASVIGFWLWRSRILRGICGVPAWICVSTLLVTTVLCKAFGAIILMFIGVGLFVTSRTPLASPIMWCVVLSIPVYLFSRVALEWHGEQFVQVATALHEERGNSLNYRFRMEERVLDRAMRHPWFGWGGWGGVTQVDDGQRPVVLDSLFIAILGRNGVVGLVALFALFLLPSIALLRVAPATLWTETTHVAAAAMAIVLLLYAIDNLLNAMPNPIFHVMSAAVIGWTMRHGAGRTLRAVRPGFPRPSVASPHR